MASGDKKSQAVVKAKPRVYKAQDMREEMALFMKPYANWEEYLVPAPISIATLGQLICISAGQGDFSINKNPPPKGFKYIRYPESFRASLSQVSNEGWHAFNEAHVNMDQIRLLTASIPGRMKLMVETLFQEEDVVHARLPGLLESMKSIVEKCTTLAHSVKDKYKSVICLIQELLDATTHAKTGYEREQEEVRTVLKQAKIREETARKNMKLAEEYYNKTKKQTEESLHQYRKAMDEVPSRWEATGMMFVESLGNAFTGIVNVFSNVVQGKFWPLLKAVPSDGSDTTESESQSPIPAKRIWGFSPMIVSNASGLKELVVKQDGINLENVYDKKTGQVKTNWVKKDFLALKNDICREEDCQPKEKALNICMSGISICEQLDHMVTSAETGKEEERAIINKIEELYQQAVSFGSYSRAPSFTPKPPNTAKNQRKSTEGSVGVQNAHLKAKQSWEMYMATQEEYQKSFENFKKQTKELAEIVCEMETYKVKETDVEAALKMLTEGLKAIGKAKEQWEKMIQFFEMISNIRDTCLSQKISDFLGFASDIQQTKGYSSKSNVTDTIHNHVFIVSSVSHLVHMITETYTELSCKHLMGRVSSLGRRLLTLKSTDPECNSEQNALSKGCEEARKAIYNMGIEKKEEFERNLEARMKMIDTELKAVFPPISTGEEKMIEAAAHDVRKELTAWEEDQFV